MKLRLFLPLLLFTLAAQAAEKKPDATKAAPAAAAKSADELWKRVEAAQEEPKVQPKSREEFIQLLTKWLTDQKTAADEFIAAFPQDPRRHAARLVTLQTGLQLSRLPGSTGPAADPEAIKKELSAIIAAPDASEEVKGEATFVQAISISGEVDRSKPETATIFFAASEAFLSKYGNHKLANQMRVAQLQLAGSVDTPEADAVLKKLAASDDAKISGAARQSITRKEKMAGLKAKPLDLKFTATDGKELSVEALRGKVVLIDFWASWCGPCISEMPNVVAAYEKYREKGFEIVGISLDQDKAAMEAALKKHKMTWRQYFDGKGWSNDISSAYGITSIPATWLLDKKGMLRESGLRGDALDRGVEKLLAEP